MLDALGDSKQTPRDLTSQSRLPKSKTPERAGPRGAGRPIVVAILDDANLAVERQGRGSWASRIARPSHEFAFSAPASQATSEAVVSAPCSIATPLSASKMRTASLEMATGTCEPMGACTSRPPTAIK